MTITNNGLVDDSDVSIDDLTASGAKPASLFALQQSYQRGQKLLEVKVPLSLSYISA